MKLWGRPHSCWTLDLIILYIVMTVQVRNIICCQKSQMVNSFRINFSVPSPSPCLILLMDTLPDLLPFLSLSAYVRLFKLPQFTKREPWHKKCLLYLDIQVYLLLNMKTCLVGFIICIRSDFYRSSLLSV